MKTLLVIGQILAWLISTALPVIYAIGLYYEGDGMLALILFLSGVGIIWMWIMGLVSLFYIHWAIGVGYLLLVFLVIKYDDDFS